jgi:drug/metabolite transporter (DMT)-like permease
MGAQLLCSSVVMAVLCLFLTDLPTSVQVSSVLAVAVLGALATGLAFIWMYRVIALAGSVVSASVTYATPLVSTLLGILLLGETLTWNQPLGAVIVLIGAALVQGLIGRPASERRPSSS